MEPHILRLTCTFSSLVGKFIGFFLTFIFKDAYIEKECHYKISLSYYPPDTELYEIKDIITPESLLTNFPIEFTLTAKQFKKSIGDASNFSDNITFEKLGEHPLQLTYSKSN